MMPFPDIFPVPLIHISETNSTNFRSGTTWQFLGIRSWQESSFQHRYLPRFFGSTTSVSHFTDYIFSY